MTEEKITMIVESCLESVKKSNKNIFKEIIENNKDVDQLELFMTILYNTVSSVVTDALIKYNCES